MLRDAVSLRTCPNTIAKIRKTVCRWPMNPKSLAPHSTTHDALNTWTAQGLWPTLNETLRTKTCLMPEIVARLRYLSTARPSKGATSGSAKRLRRGQRDQSLSGKRNERRQRDEALGHEADESEVNEGLVMALVLLVVACEATLLHQPAEAAFDDPAARQHNETLLIFKLPDDTHDEAGCVPEKPPHALHEGIEFASVTAVGEDDDQVQEAEAQQAEQQLRAVTMLHAGGRDHHAQEQAVGVGKRMALAASDHFARGVAAAQSWSLPAFDRLAVDDSGAGRGVLIT